MPPKAQWSGLRGATESSPVTGLSALPTTDFVLTSSARDASVNIWSTRAGLTRVHGLNFKLQACIDPEGSLKRAQLYFLNFEVEDLGSGVKIYTRDSLGDQKPSSAPKQVEAEADNEKGDGELMQAMFDESAVIGEACPEEETSNSSLV